MQETNRSTPFRHRQICQYNCCLSESTRIPMQTLQSGRLSYLFSIEQLNASIRNAGVKRPGSQREKKYIFVCKVHNWLLSTETNGFDFSVEQ